MSETDQNQDSLTEDDWSQVKEIFAGAILIDPNLRSKYIQQQCGGKKIIIDEVESLLVAYKNAGFFLEAPAVQEVAIEITDERSILNEGELLTHYKIIRKIGTGGMGEVYLAGDNKLDRQVAIKILSQSHKQDRANLERFLREAKIASGLNHPNIMTVHEIGVSDGIHYIVSEFIEGEILSSYVQKNDLLLTEVLDLLIQVAGALVVAHRMGIIHRDIKPENIMIRDDGIAKVLDFGLAKLIINSQQGTETQRHGAEDKTFITESPHLPGSRSPSLTSPGRLMGTPNYMSPDQARGKAIDARSDLWSFGVIIFQLMTGKLPFTGETMSDMLTSILKSEPPQLSAFVSDIPPELEKLVNKCLRRNLAERYQNAGDLLGDLQSVRQILENSSEVPTLRQIRRDENQNTETVQNVTVPPDGRQTSFLGRVSSILSEKVSVPGPGFLPLLLVILGLFLFSSYRFLIPENNISYESAKLVAVDGAAGDTFGIAVAISENTVVVGDSGDDDNGMSSGSAYVFIKNDNNWELQQKLTPLSDGQAFSVFGSSVDIAGDTIIVGAAQYDNPGYNEGAAYVFVRSGTTWTEQQRLVPADPRISFGFGASVALEEDTAIIGANNGAAYLFVRNGTNWTEHQKLVAADNLSNSNNQFGKSVDISGDTVVVGSYYDDIAGNVDQGSAYIFVKNGANWVEQQKLVADDGGPGDQFGIVTAISGDTLVVGASLDDVDGQADQGSAYVFVRNGTVWRQQKKLVASDGVADDRFGSGVATTGNKVILGAYGVDVRGKTNQGSAYIFERDAGGADNWGEVRKLLATDGGAEDFFGVNEIAISGERVVIGAYQNDVSGNTNQGAVYIFMASGETISRAFQTDQAGSLPIAEAGEYRRVDTTGPGWARVTLDGSGSSDPHGHSLTYSWRGPFPSITGKVVTVTIPLGLHEITLTVDDGHGGVSTDTVSINVRYKIAAFLDPIDNINFNVVKAGQGVPFEFTLNGNYGLDVLTSGYPVSNEVPCVGLDISDKAIPLEKNRNGSLRYDAATDRYKYVWGTSKDWAKTCRMFLLKLNDGSAHSAYFQFE